MVRVMEPCHDHNAMIVHRDCVRCEARCLPMVAVVVVKAQGLAACPMQPIKRKSKNPVHVQVANAFVVEARRHSRQESTLTLFARLEDCSKLV